MHLFTKDSLRSAGITGTFLLFFFISACSSSDDAVAPSMVQAGVYDSTVVEGADDLEFVIGLSSASSESVSVDYVTADGTAEAGVDYSATSGTAQFAPGEVRKFVTVNVLNNTSAPTASSRNMKLVLSNPDNAALNTSSATGTIIANDFMPTDAAFNPAWTPKGAFTNAATCGCLLYTSPSPRDS
mgnify:CR=1 FL=1